MTIVKWIFKWMPNSFILVEIGLKLCKGSRRLSNFGMINNKISRDIGVLRFIRCNGQPFHNTVKIWNGLSPGRRQAIIWTNAGILLIGPWGTNFSEILIGIQAFSFKEMHLKMSSAKWCQFCLGLNVLRHICASPGLNKLPNSSARAYGLS